MLSRVTVFGLGEAGSLFAADLVAAEIAVTGFDPAPVATPDGVNRTLTPEEAVADAELVIALTPGSDAMTALTQAIDDIPETALYADLSTASAATKKALAARAAGRNLLFIDVALMGTVPGRGLRTPALASGPGAERYVALVTDLNVPVARIAGDAGNAATRKLLRSVMMKGLAALMIESMWAAEQAGCAEWLWKDLAKEISAADEALLSRLVHGTLTHAKRRLHEMRACEDLLNELGQDPVMTHATVESLKRVLSIGIPEIPESPES